MSEPKRARGRPKVAGSGLPHTKRPPVSPDHPHHVTIRVRRGTWNLRSQRCFKHIAKAFGAANARKSIRVVHYSVQGNHLHLLVEADDRAAMSNGLRALLISMARRLNDLMGRSGSLFADRFHERALMTASAVRRALRYVLLNAQRHFGADPCDAYSSGPWFESWPRGTVIPRWTPCRAPPTADPESRLLRGGWKRAGAF